MTYPREWLPEEWWAADEGLRLRRGYRRTDFQMIITSDYGGFAGGMVPEMCCPPVTGLSPEEEIPKDYHLRPTRLRRSSAAATYAPPASICSPELMYPARDDLR